MPLPDLRWLLFIAGTGFGAMAIIGWEVAEYFVMKAGVGGLSLTYADTLGDLVLSTIGGALGAALVLRRVPAIEREAVSAEANER